MKKRYLVLRVVSESEFSLLTGILFNFIRRLYKMLKEYAFSFATLPNMKILGCWSNISSSGLTIFTVTYITLDIVDRLAYYRSK